MRKSNALFVFFTVMLILSGCVSKKKFAEMQKRLESSEKTNFDLSQSIKGKLEECNKQTALYKGKFEACTEEVNSLKSELALAQTNVRARQQQVDDLKTQLADARQQRDKQYQQVGDLTVLSQTANNNIRETLTQLEKKDKYIHLLQAAKTKADSINLALAVNLTKVLSEGIGDKDIEVKVDKTVVFINISDKMLFQSGSSNITPKAGEILGKIAKIIASRPELEVMVEGYTDNVPMKSVCMEDNWDLSVKRATAVVRILQKSYGVNPNRMIAAGRGEYNTLTANDTPEGKATNRRTRIIILPKLDQFYDLLNPNNVPK